MSSGTVLGKISLTSAQWNDVLLIKDLEKTVKEVYNKCLKQLLKQDCDILEKQKEANIQFRVSMEYVKEMKEKFQTKGIDLDELEDGCLQITFTYSSHEALHQLYTWYITNELHDILHDGLITEYVLNEFGVTSIKLDISISEEYFSPLFKANLGKDDETVATERLSIDVGSLQLKQRATEPMMAELELWRKEKSFTVETKVTSEVSKAMKDRDVIMVVGCAGSGKRSSIHYGALQLEGQGYEIYPIEHCKDLLNFYSSDVMQAFVITNPVGLHGVNKELYEDWAKFKEKVFAIIASKTTKLIMSVRKEVFNETEKDFLHKDLTVEILDLTNDRLKLTKEERWEYICNLMKKRKLEKPSNLTKAMVEHCDFDFFPALCQCYCTSDVEVRKNPESLFKEPYELLEKHITKNIWHENPAQFCGLVLCVVYGGRLPVKLLNELQSDSDVLCEQDKIKGIIRSFEIHEDLRTIRHQLDLLNCVYVNKTEYNYEFVHQIYQDMVSFVLGKKEMDLLLQFCDLNFLLERCTFPTDVMCIRQKMNNDRSYLYTRDICKKPVANKYNITIHEEHKQKLATKFVEKIGENFSTEKFHSLVRKMFESVFLHDENFLHFFKSALTDGKLTESRTNVLQYEVCINSCLIHKNDLIDVSFFANYHSLDAKHEFNQEITPMLASIYSDNLKMVEELLKNHGSDVNEFGSKSAEVSVEDSKTMEKSRNIYEHRFFLGNLLINLDLCDDQYVNLLHKNMYASTPLCFACKKEHMSMVELLLRYDADVNKFDDEGNTPLTYAVERCNREIIDCLLSHKADVNLCGENFFSSTPLCSACRNGYEDIVELLISHNADVNKCDGKGCNPLTYSVRVNKRSIAAVLIHNKADDMTLTPLCSACKDGTKEMVQFLLENEVDDTNYTPLIHSVSGNYEEIVVLLINKDADVSLKGKGDEGSTPICSACEKDNAKMVELLIDNKADVNQDDGEGSTPLIRSVKKTSKRIAQLLIYHGADVNLPGKLSYNKPPLMFACVDKNLDMADLLLVNEADINQQDGDGCTPLLYAISVRNVTLTGFLVDYLADVNLPGSGKYSYTPMEAAYKSRNQNLTDKLAIDYAARYNLLILAFRNDDVITAKGLLRDEQFAIKTLCDECRKGQRQLIDFLLLAGARVNKPDADYRSPLMHAIESNEKEIVKILLRNNADTNFQGFNNFTPLDVACRAGRKHIVDLLLENHADVQKCDERGHTSLIYCIEEGYTEIAVLLLCKYENKSQLLCDKCREGNEKVVKFLLCHSVNPDTFYENGVTPLTKSVENNNKKLVHLLLRNGADVDLYEGFASTPLCTACRMGNEEMFHLLRHHGADINKRDGMGKSPMEYAIENNNTGIVRSLSNVPGINIDQGTLNFAREHANYDIIQIILAILRALCRIS